MFLFRKIVGVYGILGVTIPEKSIDTISDILIIV